MTREYTSVNAMIHGYLYYMHNLQDITIMTYIGYIYYRIIGVSRDRVLQDTLAVPFTGQFEPFTDLTKCV